MGSVRQIRVHPPATVISDPQQAVRLSAVAPTAFRKAQYVLLATQACLRERGFFGADRSHVEKVMEQLHELAAALKQDGFMSADTNLQCDRDVLVEFLSRFSDAFPNWQEEYNALNRLISMSASSPQDPARQYRETTLPKSLETLAQQYRGTTLPKLVEKQIRSFGEEDLLAAIRGTFHNFPAQLREPLDSFTEEYLRNWFSPHILTTDLSELFSSAIKDVESVAKECAVTLSEEMVFDIFNIMVMKLSYFASSRREFRKQLGIKKGWFS